MAYADYVTLVDRTGLGGVDIIYDGAVIKFYPGQTEKPVPAHVAEWLFRVDQQKVHTTDGEYVQRFGIKDSPEAEEVVRNLGKQPCSPITIDTNRVEGWDTDQFAADRPEMRTVTLKRNPADYANVATQGGFGNER